MLEHFKASVDIGRNVPIHLVCVVPMNERTERMILLERVSFAAKGHPAHLSAKCIDHGITFPLAVNVRISVTLRKLLFAAIDHDTLTERLCR